MKYKKGSASACRRRDGFTLLELLVVVAIVGILTTVVVAALTSSRKKGGDAGVKANLRNAISQGEIFYGTNTASPNSYTSVCTNGIVGGAKGVGAQILAAARANGYTYGVSNINPATTNISSVTCNFNANGWAAQVPLKETAGYAWCVDWTGKSIQTANSLSDGTDVLCN
jgi:prepilin-type N-terminal cleavage/methylation domain-containing protein